MRAEKRRHKYRVIAFLAALLLTVSDAGMTALARPGVVYDVTSLEGEGTGGIVDEETNPADGGTGDEETNPADGGTGDEETNPADGEAGDEETDPAEDDETITDDGQLEIDALTMDISGNDLMLNSVSASLGTPGNLVLDNGSTDIRLSWDMVSGADEYEIQFAIDEDLSPDKLKDEDFKTYITVDPDKAVEETSGMWPPYVTVAGNRMTYTFAVQTLPVDPENSAYIAGFNYFPTLSQYAVYRVRAVDRDETAETGGPAESEGGNPTYGEFSNYASANGMFNYDKEKINEERRERFDMPGSGDYVRFFLGDAEGIEYNEKNPIKLHVGESIDGLTLWAVCEDGTKVSYPQMRDAIIKAERAGLGYADYYRQTGVDNGYNFTWAIDELLAGRDNMVYCCDEMYHKGHIQPFYKYLGNTVPDCLGIKALVRTNGTAYLGVSLNSSHSVETYMSGSSFRFFVPIQILDAEQGGDYPELDDESVICETGEEFWAAARQKIRDREEIFVVLMPEQAYEDFCDKYDYYTIYEQGTEYETKGRMSLCEERIINHWLYTQYEEQEWMEPWAGDNLSNGMISFFYSEINPSLNVNGNEENYRGITCSAQYRTTAEQERELEAKIAELLGEGGALHEAYVSDSQLKKIQAAYNYTKGIKWVNGLEDPLNFTVYSGVILV